MTVLVKKPYVNQRTNSLETNFENYSLRTARITENCPNFSQQENVLNLTNMHLIRKTFSELVTDLSSFFSDRALEQQIPVWGPQLQRAVQPEREVLQRNLQNCNNNYKKNRESVNQVSFLSSMSHKPIEENIPVGGRMKHFLHNWEKFSGY